MARILPLLFVFSILLCIANCECPECTKIHDHVDKTAPMEDEDLEELLQKLHVRCLKLEDPNDFLQLQQPGKTCETTFIDLFDILREFTTKTVVTDIRAMAVASIGKILNMHNTNGDLTTFMSSQSVQLTTVYTEAEARIRCLVDDASDEKLDDPKKLEDFDEDCFRDNYISVNIDDYLFDISKPFNHLSTIQYYLVFLVKDFAPNLKDRYESVPMVRTLLDNLMTVFYYLEAGSIPTQSQGDDDEVIDYKINFEASGAIEVLFVLNKALGTITTLPTSFMSLTQKVQYILFDQYKITGPTVVAPTLADWAVREYWYLNFNFYKNERTVD